MGQKRDVPGDARESTLRAQEMMLDIASVFMSVDKVIDKLWEEDVVVTSLRVRIPQLDNQEYLLVVNARKGETMLVGFHGADSFHEAVRGGLARMNVGKMRFKEDTREF